MAGPSRSTVDERWPHVQIVSGEASVFPPEPPVRQRDYPSVVFVQGPADKYAPEEMSSIENFSRAATNLNDRRFGDRAGAAMFLFDKTEHGWLATKTSWSFPRRHPALKDAIGAMCANLHLSADRDGRVLPDGWFEIGEAESTCGPHGEKFKAMLEALGERSHPSHLYAHSGPGADGLEDITQTVLVDKRIRPLKPVAAAQADDLAALAHVLGLPEPQQIAALKQRKAASRAADGLDR